MNTPPPIEGFERHHRQKGDRKNWDATNILYLTPEDHKWAEAHPDEARELGWSVSRYEDPAEVPIMIPKAIHKDRPKREKKEKARDRTNVQLRVPKDEQEDGGGVWDDYMRAGRALGEKLGMTWSDTVPDYTVACFFIGKGLLAARDELETEQG